jgi:hypothetical protein
LNRASVSTGDGQFLTNPGIRDSGNTADPLEKRSLEIPDRDIVRISFRAHKDVHGNDEIVVVDSDSEDKSYYAKVRRIPNTHLLDVANRHYVIGALWRALETFQDSFVYLLHDSMILKNNVSFLEDHDVTSIRFFRSWFGVG